MPVPGWTEGLGTSLLCIILLLVFLCFLDRRWKKLQLEQERASGIMTQSYTFAINLVRHFMPSWKVQKYQFRGMKRKVNQVNIAFKDLSLELPTGAKVLHSVTGEFMSGRMCAVMGPSGAGKTTFMNVLVGKATYGKTAGDIRINGEEADIPRIKSVLGFVPQDDIVHQDLTVREQIRFSALLRNEPSISKKRVELIVDDVLNVMQIDHIQNTIVGGVEERGISGGQRKRVNIGLELAAQPNLLFLDEPTSGLDSTSSLAVVMSLKKMCQLGMTSIMVIHQPRYSLFTLFDDVLLLGKGGHTVYLGLASGCKAYMEGLGFQLDHDENPADWFMDVISGEVPNNKIEDFKPSMLPELWREGGHRHQERRAGTFGRSLTVAEDSLVLERKLEEEWDRIDRNKDGKMSQDELRDLLAGCSRMMPDNQVVHELFMRMAQPDASSVTREEFVDYLYSLRGVVADDQVLAVLDQEAATGPRRRWFRHVKTSTTTASGSDPESGMSASSSEESHEETPSQSSNKNKSPNNLIRNWWRCKTGDSLAALIRETPGFFLQSHILTKRLLVEWWRKSVQRAIFLGVLAVGAIVLASLDRWVTVVPVWEAGSILNVQTTLALLVAIFCLQVFGSNRPFFWRERSRGLNVHAFYITCITVNVIDLILQAYVFTTTYFLIRHSEVPFRHYWVPMALVAYVASGWGYFISTIVPPTHGPFLTSLVIFVVCGLLGNPGTLNMYLNGGAPEVIMGLISITRWSVMMSFGLNMEEIRPLAAEGEEQHILSFQMKIYSKGTWGNLSYWWTGFWALMIMGTILRILGYVGLRLCNRKKEV